MDFKTIDSFKDYGFEGFVPIDTLLKNHSIIPKVKGIYMVLSLSNQSHEFLLKGSGGFFKGKDPNVSIEELKGNWVEGAMVLYIGKAGGENSSSTLNSRIKQLIKFGDGNNIGHYGGRFLWQVKDGGKLIICWNQLPNNDPREIEKLMINNFKKIYVKRPFANLQD